MSPFLDLAIVLLGLNSAILIFLLYIYGKIALRTKASYSIGLFVFALLMLLQSAGTAVGYFVMAPYFGDEALPLMSVVASFELMGLAVLIKITL